jgi:transcriptional regulator with GAF, ATPase, and Fis domain
MHYCRDFIPAQMEGRLAFAWKRAREIEELAQAGITPAEAARVLGIRPQAVWDRMKAYGIRFPGTRGPYRRAA